MDLVKEYMPMSIEDIVGNKKQAYDLKNWLSYFKEIDITTKKKKKSSKPVIDYCSCVIITGPHGIGKTTTVNTVINSLNYNINKDNFITKKENNCKTSFNVLNLLNNKKTKDIIIIDELESISSPQEKNQIIKLLKKNENERIFPIILISNNQHNKFLSDIKKIAYEIRFYKPYSQEIKKILSKISKSENIRFESMEIVDLIIDYCSSDIRKLIYLLNDLKNITKKKSPKNNKYTITKKIFYSYINTTQEKETDFNLFESAEKLLYKYNNIDEALSHFESQPVLLPLMMHQYYTNTIIDNVDDDDKKFELAKELSDSLSIGDVIENIVYGDQNWKAREIHGIYTCVNSSFLLSYNKNTEDTIKTRLEFPKDLNKTSIKKINKKNIDNANKCIINKNIIDYIYICKIVKQLIKNNKLKECSQLLKPHGIKLEHIESLLKIEKIQYNNPTNSTKSTTKITLTSKQKKELNAYLDE